MLYLEQIIKDPNKQIRIALPTGDKVVGILAQDVTLTGGSEWNSPDDTQSSMLGNASNGLNKASMLSNWLLGTSFTQQRVVAPADTTATWMNAQRPTFNLDMVFLAINESDDVRLSVAKLMKAAYPTRSMGGFRLTAPGGYSAAVDGTAKNTCIVEIGNYFRAPDMIIVNVTTTFSKSILKSGIPVRADVNVVVSPYRTPDKDEVAAYFTGGG